VGHHSLDAGSVEPVLSHKQIKAIKKKRKRRTKLSRDQIAAYFKKAGCELLTTLYVGTKQQLKYRCKCGAVRFTCFNNFSRGCRCMKCYLKQFEESKKEKRYKLKLRAELYTINDVATIMGVKYEDLWNAIRVTEILPAPTRSAGRIRKYYNEKDVRKMLEMVELHPINQACAL
jgi:hypothetical protein